jgi:hypothetical protein
MHTCIMIGAQQLLENKPKPEAAIGVAGVHISYCTLEYKAAR